LININHLVIVSSCEIGVQCSLSYVRNNEFRHYEDASNDEFLIKGFII